MSRRMSVAVKTLEIQEDLPAPGSACLAGWLPGVASKIASKTVRVATNNMAFPLYTYERGTKAIPKLASPIAT